MRACLLMGGGHDVLCGWLAGVVVGLLFEWRQQGREGGCSQL